MPLVRSILSRVRSSLQLARAVHLVWRGAPALLLASLGLMLLQALLPLASLYLTKLTVDAVTAAANASDKGVAWARAAQLVGWMAGVALLSAAVAAVVGLVRDAQAQAVTDYLSEVVQAKSVEVDLQFYESWQYYDTLHRAQAEGPSRPLHIVGNLTLLAQSAISLTGVVGLLVAYSPLVGLAIVLSLIPDMIVRYRFASQAYRWQRESTQMQRRAGYYDWLVTSGYYAKEIRLFELGGTFIQRFRELRRQLRRGQLDIAARRALAELAAALAAVVAVYASFGLVAYRAVYSAISVGSLVMYLAAFQQGRSLLSGTVGALSGLYEDSLFLTNLSDFLALERRVAEPKLPVPVPSPLRGGIVYDHVSFRYPSGERLVLEDVSLSIEPGETVALVGENGSGKTTLVKLLCRLYDPTSGAIRLDGVDLREMRTSELRQQISVIFQDYANYQLSARDNIWVGDVRADPYGERLLSAARLAGADAVVKSLPQGYDTVLGSWFEHGLELSIGQWQKIALARAFLRDARIIVLDEPTSAQDAASEYELFQHLRELTRDRTTMLISHRFSTVRLADRIFVLQHGRIIEQGSHHELMRAGGLYARLYEMQAQAYH